MGSQQGNQAFRVIDVFPSSPAQESGLQSYLDFILSANGLHLSTDQQFSKIIQKSRGCKVFLQVYNELSKTVRDICVVPSV